MTRDNGVTGFARASLMIAITRDVSRSLAECQLSHVERTPIDVAHAASQHQEYRKALESLGCRVIVLPAEPDLPDAVFVEDMAVVVDEVAVITRPGAASRRAEVDSVAEILSRYRPLRRIEAPGTLDGGDVLRIGRNVYVGRSARSNDEGIAQLRALLAPFRYSVIAVETRDCLHLKSGVTQAAENTVLLQPAWVDRAAFADYHVIEIDPTEPHAANVVRIGIGNGDALVMPDCFPRTRQRLEAAGIRVVAVDVSELQKAEGAVTCCSIVFNAPQD
ncbi:MAG: arginine deiminase family protein [Lysobacterales bacterium]